MMDQNQRPVKKQKTTANRIKELKKKINGDRTNGIDKLIQPKSITLTTKKYPTKTIDVSTFETLGSKFENVSLVNNSSTSCSIAFMSDKYVFLVYLKNQKNNNKIYTSDYEKKVNIYKLKHENEPSNIVVSFHYIIRFNNCENKIYLNAPSYIFTTDTDVCMIDSFLSYFAKHKSFSSVNHFCANNNILTTNYLLSESIILKNNINHFKTQKGRLKKIDLFMVIQQLKHTIPEYVNVVGCYILFFKENFKELLIHQESFDELPKWLVDDMKSWLSDKKNTFDEAITMIKEYEINYFEKDNSKTLTNQWDKGMKSNINERIKKQQNFIKWCYENYV